jgi:hypothetical protein
MALIKPYTLPEIEQEGLTNYDIAKCVNRSPTIINQMIERPTFKELCKANNYSFTTAVVKVGDIGRPRRYYYLPLRAAKALIATANWNEGYKYLDFLFDCEIAATQILPKAMEEIRNLRAQLESLRTKALPKPKTKKAMVPIWQPSLWGTPACVGYELVEPSEAHSFDAAWAKNVHCNRVLKGIQKAQEEAQNRMNQGRD